MEHYDDIAVVIISYNEAHNIERCIKSCKLATNEIIVIDSFSTDGTKKLAESLGATCYSKEWEGYGKAKNYGAMMAKAKWILSIDADEEISPSLAESIKSLNRTDTEVYGFKRLNHIGSKPVRWGDWNPDVKYRLYNKTQMKWNLDAVHEELVSIDGPTTRVILPGILDHYSYESISALRQKLDYYAKLSAQDNNLKAPNPNLARLKSWHRFIKGYIWKLGFLDGKLGYRIALENSIAVRKKYGLKTNR